jgi:hypothetical protein
MIDRATRVQRIRDDLFRAMQTGEVTSRGPELLQLTKDLTILAFPEAPKPSMLDSFSILVGAAMGSAIQKYETEG